MKKQPLVLSLSFIFLSLSLSACHDNNDTSATSTPVVEAKKNQTFCSLWQMIWVIQI